MTDKLNELAQIYPDNPHTPEMRMSVMDRSKFVHKKSLKELLLGRPYEVTRAGSFPNEVKICDLSYWQNPKDIDYATFCKQFDGFILRAVYGVGKDTFFETHYNLIKAQGKPVGAYHYIIGNQSPLLQAQAFRDAIAGKELELGTHIDVEDTRPGTALTRQIVDSYAENLSIVHGKAKTIYTGWNAWQVIMNGADYTDYDLWVANYRVQYPAIPPQWITAKLWQYTSEEIVPGYRERVDCSWFNGTKEQFIDWYGGVPEPPANEIPLYQVEVVCSGLNIRPQPNTDCTPLYAVPKGTILDVFEEVGLWLRVGQGRYCSGNPAYVKRIELSLEERVADLERRVTALEGG